MKEIPLTRSKVARIDDEDFERVNRHKWYAESRGESWYARASFKGKLVYMHRFLLGADPGQMVDHKDGDGLNNTRSNIRLCTSAQNNRHARKRRNSASPFKGVCWSKSHQRWVARIRAEGIFHHLGYFLDERDAAIAYNHAAVEHFREFARINVIPA
jgi:hypothetical protein